MASNKTNIYRFKETAGVDERGERIADGAITPGHYVYEVGGKVKIWATAGASAPRALFADDREYYADDQVEIDTAYTTAQTAFYNGYLVGDVVQCHIPDGETVSVDSYLTPDGLGAFVVASSAVAASLDTGVVGNNNAITHTANDAGSLGNDIKVALIDPSGNDQTLAVTVSGTYIAISLATGAGGAITSTATEVIAAIAANAGASTLIIGTDTGVSDGSGVVVAETVANLASGSDADTVILQATKAVTTSGSADRTEAVIVNPFLA